MTDNSYGEFAEYFDRLNGEAQYQKRIKYMWKLFERFGDKPSLLLDLACGTGEFSVGFAQKGCEVIAVDCSEDMLSVARQKAQNAKQDILFLCQRAENLDLYGTVNGAVCCFDSVNHITDAHTLQQAFDKVSLFLEKGCLFIFDVNTPYRHREVLGGKTFVYDEDDLYFVWQNTYKRMHDTLSIKLDIFKKQQNGYKRTVQEITERAYSDKEIKKMLSSSGFEILAVYDDLTENEPGFDSQRLYYVARKVKE